MDSFSSARQQESPAMLKSASSILPLKFQPNTVRYFPRLSAHSKCFENGAATTNWLSNGRRNCRRHRQPLALLSSLNSEKMRIENDRMQLQLMGALWPGEDAWKIQMRFRKRSGYADNELLRFENLRVPVGRRNRPPEPRS